MCPESAPSQGPRSTECGHLSLGVAEALGWSLEVEFLHQMGVNRSWRGQGLLRGSVDSNTSG